MLKTRDHSYMILSALVCAVSCVMFWSTRGDLAVAAVPLALFGAFSLAPWLTKIEDVSLVVVWLGLLLILDAPAGYPFWEYDPITESLGTLMYESASKFLGLTGLRFTGVEIGSYLLAFWLAFANNRRELLNIRFSSDFRLVAVLALLIPVTFFTMTALGAVRGNNLGLAMTQVRFIPLITCWTYIGYIACRKPEDTYLVFKVIVACMLFKSLQGWFAFLVVFDGAMGEREYLLEHLSSDYLATSMFVVIGSWYLLGRERIPTVRAVVMVAVMAFAYLLNDRRTSFVGVGMCLLLIPVVFFKQLTRRHWLMLIGAGVAGVMFIGLTWNVGGPLGTGARAIQSLLSDAGKASEASYRELEDFNLLSAIISHPIGGLGFGKRFPVLAPLPDISMFYENYDLLPHNNLLFTWVFGGPAGIAALATFIAVGIAVMIRLGRGATDVYLKLFAFVGMTMLVRWLFYIYADLGLMENRTVAMVGLAVGMSLSLISTTNQTHARGAA